MTTDLQTWKNYTKKILEYKLYLLKDKNGAFINNYAKSDQHVKVNLDGESGNKLIQKLHYLLTTKKYLNDSYFREYDLNTDTLESRSW